MLVLASFVPKHCTEIQELVQAAVRVYDAVRGNIDLKQNTASIFEAHTARRDNEAIILFTIVSSIFLPRIASNCKIWHSRGGYL